MVHEKNFKDRRIQKTRALLHQALGVIIREKPYDEIVVKEILDRANVGRSTFYMHFRDKDELLVSSIHEMLGDIHVNTSAASGRNVDSIVNFSLPVFEHIHLHRQNGEAEIGGKARAVIHAHLENVLADSIAENINQLFPGLRKKTIGPLPSKLVVQYIASTFVLVLNWWVENRSSLGPKQVNEVFRTLVLPTLSACLEEGHT